MDEKNIVDSDYVKAQIGNSKVTLLDVRTPEEFKEGHIQGSVNVDWHDATNMFGNIKKDDELKELFKDVDPDKEIIVYCRSGARAEDAIPVLEKVIGCKKIKLYKDSMLDWDEKKLPVE